MTGRAATLAPRRAGPGRWGALSMRESRAPLGPAAHPPRGVGKWMKREEGPRGARGVRSAYGSVSVMAMPTQSPSQLLGAV